MSVGLYYSTVPEVQYVIKKLSIRIYSSFSFTSDAYGILVSNVVIWLLFVAFIVAVDDVEDVFAIEVMFWLTIAVSNTVADDGVIELAFWVVTVVRNVSFNDVE